MEVINPHKVPYSLRLENGDYEVIPAGATLDDVDLDPKMVGRYRKAGLVIDGEGYNPRQIEPDTAQVRFIGGNPTQNPDPATSDDPTNQGNQNPDGPEAGNVQSNQAAPAQTKTRPQVNNRRRR